MESFRINIVAWPSPSGGDPSAARQHAAAPAPPAGAVAEGPVRCTCRSIQHGGKKVHGPSRQVESHFMPANPP
jgi:hypothetical protein